MCKSDLSQVFPDMVVSSRSVRMKHRLQRQQSLMERLREIEVRKALELWKEITASCQMVGTW